MSNAAPKLDLAAAARRLTAAQVGIRERRRFRRIPIEVNGRLLDTLGRELDCRTADISPGDIRIAAPTLPGVGERVVLYLDGFGRVSGSVARHCGEGEAAVIFDFSAHKREKMAEQLTIAMNKQLFDGAIVEDEKPIFAARPDHMTRIEFEDGQTCMGEILDFSLAGVTVRTGRAPPLIGSWARIGSIHGRVARLIEGGFAVDFEPRPPKST